MGCLLQKGFVNYNGLQIVTTVLHLKQYWFIGQSRLTRDYLKSIKQEDLSLPEGPMLLNPTSLLNALHR